MSATSIPLRLRPDLVFVPVSSRLSQWWVVKDPVSLRYHQVLPVEIELLKLLDGSRPLEEVRIEFERRCAPHRLPASRLQQFLSLLYRQGLLLVDGEDQGTHLLRRRDLSRRDQWWRTLLNPLAVRFRGVDPQRLLDFLLPWTGWLFGPLGLVLGLLVIAGSAALVFSRLEEFVRAMPSMASLLSRENLPWTAAAVAIAKVLHELGHGVACRRFGAECHEAGIMLLVGVPCLYCNVSDAWTLPRRGPRVVVSLAGIWVEMLLASLAAVVWMNTYPGYVQTLALNLVIVCSISTVVFNGNPLLRYDGYYALADLIGVPNLGPRSSRLLGESLLGAWWGMSFQSEPNLSPSSRRGFLAFGVLSWIYRVVLMVLVLWTLRSVLRPWELEGLVWMLGLFIVASVVASGGTAVAKTVSREVETGNGSMRRGLFGAGLLLAAVVGVLWFPWPRSVRGVAIIEPHAPASVYAEVSGKLVESLRAGDSVRAGQVIARLENAELERTLRELEGRRDRQETWVQSLESRRNDDPVAAAGLPAAGGSLEDLKKQVSRAKLNWDRLTIRAPREGVILPASEQTASRESGELPGWTGGLLEPANRRAWIETGSLVCQVGDPHSRDAVAYVAQSDVEFVKPGLPVVVLPDGSDVTFRGVVASVSPLDQGQPSDRQAAPGDVVIGQRPDRSPLSQPGSLVRVVLEDVGEIPLRSRGRARIEAGSWTVAELLSRELHRTFRFEW